MTLRSFLADEILVDCSKKRQSTKINSLPKFSAIWYLSERMHPWCVARVTWRPEQALLMPITITCISATTASQNVSCRQCLRELAKNKKHHCRTACHSNPCFSHSTTKGMDSDQTTLWNVSLAVHRKQCVLCTCSNSRYQAVLRSLHN